MKKLLSLIILSALLLSGCGTAPASTSENKPYEIKVGSETLSIYDNREKFEENEFEVFEDSTSIAGIMAGCKNNHIVVYNGELLGGPFIFSEDVITYKSISVGDDVSKIEDTFEYEVKSGDENSFTYNVFLINMEMKFQQMTMPVQEHIL